METAADLMRPSPVLARFDDPLSLLARRMHQLGIRHLPVVDATGQLSAMVTDQDVFDKGAFLLEDFIPFHEADEALTAGQLGWTDLVALDPDTPADQAFRALASPPHDAAVIVNRDRHPIGLLTEHDGLRAALALLPETPVPVPGPRPPITVPSNAPAALALRKMLSHQVRHVPVLEDGWLIGVLSYRDLTIDHVASRQDRSAWDTLRQRDLVSLPVGSTWVDCCRAMVHHRIGCVPLLNDAGEFLRVVSRRDLLARAGEQVASSSG
jgi:CBS domain-containing protein